MSLDFFLQAVPIGEASHPLRCLLQSKQLSQSVVLPVQNMEGNDEFEEVGPLMVIYIFTLSMKLLFMLVSYCM